MASNWDELDQVTAQPDIIDRVTKLQDRHGYVGMAMSHAETSIAGRSWTVAIEFGREAPDSPMVGGAAYGVASDLREAVEQALSEAGV